LLGIPPWYKPVVIAFSEPVVSKSLDFDVLTEGLLDLFLKKRDRLHHLPLSEQFVGLFNSDGRKESLRRDDDRYCGSKFEVRRSDRNRREANRYCGSKFEVRRSDSNRRDANRYCASNYC